MKSLSTFTHPKEFFREQICIAANNQNIKLDEVIEFYMVNLMCDFLAPEPLKVSKREFDLLQTPIAILLEETLEAQTSDRIKIFKAIGDTSLYVSGYFQDYFNDKSFSVDYFIGMGANAYSSLSELSGENTYRNEASSNIFQSLSRNFSSIVDVLAEVSDNLSPLKPQSILQTYDKWTKNQSSERLRKRLEKSGIPINNKFFKNKQ